MAAIALFSIARENRQTNRLADPENLYIPGFKGIMKEKKKNQKKKKLVARWQPFCLSVESYKSNQVERSNNNF